MKPMRGEFSFYFNLPAIGHNPVLSGDGYEQGPCEATPLPNPTKHDR